MTDYALEDARKRLADDMERAKQAALFDLMQQIMAAQLELDAAQNRLSGLRAAHQQAQGTQIPETK
jgi:hypothetical protein